MKLIHITHDRCNEFDSSTYYVIPDNMDMEAAHDIANRSREEYLKAALAFRNANEPDFPSNQISDFKYDWMTIGEAKKLRVEYDTKIGEYNLLHQKMIGAYDDYLGKHGFVRLSNYSGPDVLDCLIDWGHNHGLKLDYK